MGTGEDLGHGPDSGDDGLPEVDVEIPDDLRDLEREVQAYRREQRRLRRNRLLARYVPGYRRLGPYGVLAPIVAIALLVTAVFGSVMSLLAPKTTDPANVTSGPQEGPASAREGHGEPLPNVFVQVDGANTRLSSVDSAAIVTVPDACGCSSSIGTLTSTARSAGVAVYLSGDRADMRSLSRHNGSYPQVLDSAESALAKRYRPKGLSVVLVDDRGRVSDVVRQLEDRGPLQRERLETLRATRGS